MPDDVLDYNQELFSRSFLDCYQRQALVMLGRRDVDVGILLGGCYLPAGDMVEHLVRNRMARYNLESDLMTPDNLALAGLAKDDYEPDSFSEAVPLIRSLLADRGFVQIVSDVFYYPHCPEYRKIHIVHAVTVEGYNEAAGLWNVVDDNPASDLARYRYPTEVMAAAYDNGQIRQVRSFTRGDMPMPADPAADARRALSMRASRDHPGEEFWSSGAEMLSSPWISTTEGVQLLVEVLTAFTGSRRAVAACLARVQADTAGEVAAQVIAAGARLRSSLIVASVTGRVSPTLADDLRRVGDLDADLTKELAHV